jgi:hypothetical protein
VGRYALGVLVLLCSSACGGSPTTPSVVGQWGGDHASLSVTEQSAHVELDCAHGDASTAIRTNTFAVPGTFVREHGGPIRDGETPDSHPAMFSGTVSGDSLTLTIRLTDTNEPIGTFALTRDSPGRVVKCL